MVQNTLVCLNAQIILQSLDKPQLFMIDLAVIKENLVSERVVVII